MSKIQQQRPLSPHLSIYRWQISNTLSILHRLTGVGLTVGLIPLTLWLWGAAYDAALYTTLSQLAGSLFGKLCLFGWTWAFYYHLANGIRHLNWDIGRGFAITQMTASGQIAVVFSLSMSVLTWAIIAQKGGLL